MVSKVGAKDFKRRIIGKIKQIDNTIKDDDLYFSQTARGYYLEYKPNCPYSSGKDLVVYQDLNGSISVHGNGNSFYPGVTTFEDISDFEDDTNFHKVMTRDGSLMFGIDFAESPTSIPTPSWAVPERWVMDWFAACCNGDMGQMTVCCGCRHFICDDVCKVERDDLPDNVPERCPVLRWLRGEYD